MRGRSRYGRRDTDGKQTCIICAQMAQQPHIVDDTAAEDPCITGVEGPFRGVDDRGLAAYMLDSGSLVNRERFDSTTRGLQHAGLWSSSGPSPCQNTF